MPLANHRGGPVRSRQYGTAGRGPGAASARFKLKLRVGLTVARGPAVDSDSGPSLRAPPGREC